MLNYPTVCAQGSLSRETRQQSRKQFASHVSRRRRGCRHKPGGLQEIAVHNHSSNACESIVMVFYRQFTDSCAAITFGIAVTLY